MTGRNEIIIDLQRVDEQTDSIVDPNQYDFLGDFEFEDVIDNFGTWQQALDNAEISLKHKIAEDVMRLKKDVEGNLTQPEYSEKGNYPLSVIQQEYGTWNKLKESLGLDIHQRNISDEELEKDMKRVAEIIDHPLTTKKYNQLGNYSSGVFILRDYTFSEFRDKIGLEKPKSRGYPSKEALKAWYNELKAVKGRFGADELKQKLCATGHNYSSAYRKSLQDYLIERGFQFSVSSGGDGSKYYIKGPEAPTLEEYYQQFLDKIPSDKENWFMEMSGTGTSPKSITAAIRYLTEDKSQAEISEEENVTEVSVRNTKNKIIDRFNLEDGAGKDIIYDSEGDRDKVDNDKCEEESLLTKIKSMTQEEITDYFIDTFESLDYEVEDTKLTGPDSFYILLNSHRKILIRVLLDSKFKKSLIEETENMADYRDADYAELYLFSGVSEEIDQNYQDIKIVDEGDLLKSTSLTNLHKDKFEDFKQVSKEEVIDYEDYYTSNNENIIRKIIENIEKLNHNLNILKPSKHTLDSLDGFILVANSSNEISIINIEHESITDDSLTRTLSNQEKAKKLFDNEVNSILIGKKLENSVKNNLDKFQSISAYTYEETIEFSSISRS